ncbi:unnamed protein product [Sphagnum jensenii]|uniref:Ubiquitin-specific protease family C19-related protein n=1 Tax=Sphagnum jensenii TaxID=128206 RepID=A0ABP0VUB0_9BRYO
MGAPSGNQPIAQTWFPSHQLSNGLYVSGHRDPSKEKGSTISVPQTPYTGGDVKKSGELGKMAGLIHSASLKGSGGGRGAFGRPTSGPLTRQQVADTVATGNSKSMGVGGGTATLKSSGSLSGPQTPVLPATGLITSGPLAGRTAGLSSGPLSGRIGAAAGGGGMSGPQDMMMMGGSSGGGGGGGGATPAGGAAAKAMHAVIPTNPAVNNLSNARKSSFWKRFPKVIIWTVGPLFVMGFIAGAFIVAAVRNPILLIVVASLLALVLLLLTWNSCWGHRSVTGFITSYPVSELATAKDGQFVKVTGVVTCGSVPLESSYQKVNRCIYTSTSLYEYRQFSMKPAAQQHRYRKWSLRHMERFVVDFYISDLQTGLRALVKAGYGASVTPYVEESVILDVTPNNKELPSDFIRWLTQRNLSANDRVMQLREGHVKEGSTVTVMGVVQRHENVLMIVPPPGPVSTGCQWNKALLPASMEGLMLRCEEVTKVDGIPLSIA